MEKVINVFVSLPLMASDEYAAEIADEAVRVREVGAELCLQMDWHVLSPYHAPPPHLGNLRAGLIVGKIGYGYAPFGWRAGWMWALDKMQKLVDALRPEYILYGDDPHIRHGWGFVNPNHDPAVASYNDTLGILYEALYGVGDLPGTRHKPNWIVIPRTDLSAVQRRGIQRVHDRFEGIGVLPEQDVVFSYLEDEEPEIPVEPPVVDPPIIVDDIPPDADYDHPAEVFSRRAYRNIVAAMVAIDDEDDVLAELLLRKARKQVKKAIKLL